MIIDTTVNPAHSESVLLAQILQILIAGGGGSASGNQVYDPTNAIFYTLTAPNGVLTLGAGSGSGLILSTVFDPVNNISYNVTAPNGILTLS